MGALHKLAVAWRKALTPTPPLKRRGFKGFSPRSVKQPLHWPATPLVLRLTSPAGRPIQTTRDLPGFWAGSWAAVAKEMRGKYPRHPWPEDPTQADPTLRTKRATARHA